MDTIVQRNELKRLAAEAAVELIRPGMVIGLGYGSTAEFATRRIGALIQSGMLYDIVAVPSAEATVDLARQLAIPLTSLDDVEWIDLTIDGADEVDPHLNLIKGGGGALLREKMVAQATRREVIVIDAAKLSPQLGTNFALPIEVIPFGVQSTIRWIEKLGAKVTLRRDRLGQPVYTDQRNVLLDCHFGPIADPAALAATLAERAGIVEHGLFIGITSAVFVADPDGVRVLHAVTS
ncbi:MAG: ribose-5-phosphate isomerase RpiA [Oscillochloris sp.]|nr:ribose-5-phosphate isomerase RpiA [Oscillochloris sp.]